MTDCREWPAGTRVRCVDGGGPFVPLTAGENYTVRVWTDAPVPGVMVAEVPGRYYAHRFKPVVRVKMGRRELSRPLRLHGFKADEPIDLLGMVLGDYLYA